MAEKEIQLCSDAEMLAYVISTYFDKLENQGEYVPNAVKHALQKLQECADKSSAGYKGVCS